jgi:hypothetical protein
LLAGCLDPYTDKVKLPAQIYVPTAAKARGNSLVLVGALAWQNTIQQYATYRSAQGYEVQTLYIETIINNSLPGSSGEALRDVLNLLSPDYVFLIGDVSIVPTIYTCSDTSQSSTYTDKACIYSDYMLSVVNNVSMFPVGRIQASTENELANYLTKAIKYDVALSLNAFSGAYLLSDRVYDPTDEMIIWLANLLSTDDVSTEVNVIEADDVKSAAPDNYASATYATFNATLKSNVSFIQYYGHGGNVGWGYDATLTYTWIDLVNEVPIPLVYAMACETAIEAPNPPYYPYYDSNGELKNYGWWNAAITGNLTAAMVGTPAEIQPHNVLTDNMGRHMTSADPGGAMVYIGETDIEPEEETFNSEFYASLAQAYYYGNETIGDIWFNATANMLNAAAINGADVHPEFFQFDGDPTVAFPKNR